LPALLSAAKTPKEYAISDLRTAGIVRAAKLAVTATENSKDEIDSS